MENQNLEQGGDAWHKWRLRGIGSSDAPIILGVSPWRTAYDLWEEKTQRKLFVNSSNWATTRGNNLEPIARAMYEMETATSMPPTLATHATYPFLRASLDGYNEKEGVVLEIKCPGKEDHQDAKAGKIPQKYLGQLDHQLLVTGAARVDYFSFDGTVGVTVAHLPDRERLKALLNAELEFWKCIEFDEPPALSARDFKKIKNKELSFLLRKWKRLKSKIILAEKEESDIRKQIIAGCDHPRMTGCGVRIQSGFRKGSIQYKNIPVLKELNLEEYRAEGVTYWKMEIEK